MAASVRASSFGRERHETSPPQFYPSGRRRCRAANAINATLYENLNYSFLRDIVPVGRFIRVAVVMVVNSSLPPKTVPEFIAYAKANAGKINVGSGGPGDPDHASAELFNIMTGVGMTHVPYRGLAPALADLIGAQVHVVFATVPAAIENIKAGRLRALAVTTAMRSELLPELPTVADFVPGYESSQWYGIGTPKRPRARPPTSSTSSARRSMRRSPMPR